MGEVAMDVPVVESDERPVDVDLTPKADANGGKIVTADEGIESLKEQAKRARDDSQRRMADAQRQIDEAHQRAIAAETEVKTTRKDVVSSVIESLGKDKDSARRDYSAAMAAGDYDKAAEAQDRMSMANARLVEAEKGRLALDEQIKAPNQQQPVYVDDVEKLARNLSPRSAAWVREHPEFASGDANARMVRAHYSAIGEGLPPESDDYFKFINQRLGIERAAPVEDRQMQSRDSGGRSPLSAPVGRDVSQAPRSSNPGVIRLSAEEVATAKALDMTVQDYARYLRDCVAEGKINRQL